jgi:hypothetical protein
VKQFEYYDSQFSSEGMVLVNLRRWLNDESVDKNVTPPTLKPNPSHSRRPTLAILFDIVRRSLTTVRAGRTYRSRA